MDLLANAVRAPPKKRPGNFSAEQTRLASPSETAPPAPKNLNYALPAHALPKEDLSACSIGQNEGGKLIFPKFFRRHRTLRDLSAPLGGPGKSVRSVSEFRPVRPFASPQFQIPFSPPKSRFVRPASRRLADFSRKVVSNFSFTNCFFEANASKVGIAGETRVKYLWPAPRGLAEPASANLGPRAGKRQKPFDKGQIRRAFGEVERPNPKALEWKRKNLHKMLSIKNNFSFRKIGAEAGLNAEGNSNAPAGPGHLIKPKTKRICKAGRRQMEGLYHLVKQTLREEREARRARALEITGNASALYQPGFFFHSENRICRRLRAKARKSILEALCKCFYCRAKVSEFSAALKEFLTFLV